jgi:hypothetical protein
MPRGDDAEKPAERRRLRLALGAACLLALAFGLRLVLGLLHWSERADPPIQGWMTIGFVAHAFDVEHARLAEALGVAPAPGERTRLADVAARTGRAPAEVIAAVERVVRPDRPAPAP